MARFSVKIGFKETVESEPGIYNTTIVEKPATADMIYQVQRTATEEEVNDTVTLGHQISIVINPYISSNLINLAYVKMHGVKWRIKTFEVYYPRIKISLGGVYND